MCGRPQGDGIQEKYGYCRIKIENNGTDFSSVNLRQKHIKRLKYLLNLPQISCNSQLLKDLFPDISKLMFNLSDFVLVRKCSGICNPGIKKKIIKNLNDGDDVGCRRGWYKSRMEVWK